MDCFELEQDYDTFLNLIPIFPKVWNVSSCCHIQPLSLRDYFSAKPNLFDMQSHASQILGFKFQYYQRLEVNSPVPSGLYKLTALLVKKDFINLESMLVIFPFLFFPFFSYFLGP